MKNSILLPPSLFRTWNYCPPSPDVPRKFIFICNRTDQGECTLFLRGEEHQNVTTAEFLNACAIVMFDLNTCENLFSLLAIGGSHIMHLTKREATNILLYMHKRQEFKAKA